MWNTMNAIESRVNRRRKSPGAATVALLLSMLLICQLQIVCSFLQPADLSISPRRLSSQRALSTTLAIMSRRNKAGDAENQADSIDNKNAKSNTATIPGYTFFRSSGRRDGDSKSTGGKGYVPSGMSREEYSAIRKMEAEKERKMNYGAWGPRFFRTERPDGDWMVMPNLWTFGQVDNNRQPLSNDGTGEPNGVRPSMRRRIQSLAQVHGPAFLLGYVLVDSLAFCYALWKFKQIQDSAVLKKTFGLAFAVFRLFSGLVPRLQFPVAESLLKINALKVAAAMLQIPLWNRLMEVSNRRWLWSKKRFATTITSVAMTGITIFGILLLR